MSPAGPLPPGFATRADAISVVAAHGLSARVIGTWDPRLVRPPRDRADEHRRNEPEQPA